MNYKITRTRPIAGKVDQEFVAEVEQRCATAIALARCGAIRASLVLHILDDGSFYGYPIGDMPADLRELARRLGELHS